MTECAGICMRGMWGGVYEVDGRVCEGSECVCVRGMCEGDS